ncbi:unnamed protein product [Cylicocyclus nassatus]|uniref:Uncharacterized protein n=1 Tax=Cylicocyclus nassatus TaxID=53992 RepID=A0AA36H7V9_CYLNA|nr:unnamed protein product [Cylicocyclus nassatus]
MYAFLLLFALILSCHARSLGEEQRRDARVEDKDRRREQAVVTPREKDVSGTTQELEPWEKPEIPAAALEGSHNPADKRISAKVSLKREDKQEKAGLWNAIKKAASFVAKSAKEGLAKLNRQISRFLGSGKTVAVTITTPAHAIKRKSIDEKGEENTPEIGHENGNDEIPMRSKRQQKIRLNFQVVPP